MRTKTIARWRRAALAGALATTLALPSAAQMQPAPKPEAQEQPATKPEVQALPAQPVQKPENAPVVTEQSPRPPPDTNIKPVPGAPEEYVIVKGDTLWDLSQKFLNNPWYWPKIWSLNPSIENPHWIYPGNRLRIVPSEGGGGERRTGGGRAGRDAGLARLRGAPEGRPAGAEQQRQRERKAGLHAAARGERAHERPGLARGGEERRAHRRQLRGEGAPRHL